MKKDLPAPALEEKEAEKEAVTKKTINVQTELEEVELPTVQPLPVQK